MKIISGDAKSLEFLITHFDASRIRVFGVLDSSDDQSFLSGRMRNEFNDRFKRDQGLGTPVDGNVGEEWMFDLVPFRAYSKTYDRMKAKTKEVKTDATYLSLESQ